MATAALVNNSIALTEEVVTIFCKLVKEEGNESVREHAFNVLRLMMPFSTSTAVKSVVMLIKVSHDE